MRRDERVNECPRSARRENQRACGSRRRIAQIAGRIRASKFWSRFSRGGKKEGVKWLCCRINTDAVLMPRSLFVPPPRHFLNCNPPRSGATTPGLAWILGPNPVNWGHILDYAGTPQYLARSDWRWTRRLGLNDLFLSCFGCSNVLCPATKPP